MHVYRAERAFDGRRFLDAGASVFVEDGRIVGLGPAGAPVPEGCDVTEFEGATMLPGLIDAHVHLCGDDGPRALDQLPELSAEQLEMVIADAMRAQLAAGVTTVRDLGDRGYAVVDRRGGPTGPTVLASGPPITSVGGHCASMGGEAAGLEDLCRAVLERAERGVDVVKIMTSGGVLTPGTDVTKCQFSVDEVRAVVDEAHAAGLPVTAHAHALAAVELCVLAGVDGIEHCTCMTTDGLVTPPDLVERMASAGTIVCPTLGRRTTIEPPPHIKALMERTGMTWESRRAQVGELIAGGVRLISGGDAGINQAKPHGVLPTSVCELVTAGMPAAQALASATGDAAAALGLASRKGRLQAGFDADLVFVDGDPGVHIDALHRVRAVVHKGRRSDGARPEIGEDFRPF